jgi:hypothetical protein
MKKNNIKHEKGTPYAHYYLGPVERPILVIANGIRILLIDTHLPEKLWIELVKTVVYLRNKSLIRILNQSTPYEYFYKKKLNISYFRIISLAIYCHEIKSESGPNRRKKLESKTRKYRLIGYGKGIT